MCHSQSSRLEILYGYVIKYQLILFIQDTNDCTQNIMDQKYVYPLFMETQPMSMKFHLCDYRRRLSELPVKMLRITQDEQNIGNFKIVVDDAGYISIK